MGVPSVTVAVPAFNARPWIAEMLESVLVQTDPADEIVVVDDGSTDGTADAVAAVDSSIRVVRQENRGAPGAYNRGFREATSDFVAMCPADDIWKPSKLQWQRALLRADEEIDIAFGGAEFFGRHSGVFPRTASEGRLERRRFMRDLYQECLVPAPTAVVRRRTHGELGGFREDIAIEDYEFWFRALTNGAQFHFDPRVMVRLRQHDTNLGSSDALMVWKLNLQIHRRYAAALADPDLSSRVIARDLAIIGRCHLGRGELAEGRAAYRDSVRTHRTASATAVGALTGVPGASRVLSWLRPTLRDRDTMPESDPV